MNRETKIDVEQTVYLNIGMAIGELLFGDDTKSPVRFAVKSEKDTDENEQ